MKIVIDDKIPYILDKLHLMADEVVPMRGTDIGPQDVRDADALIVRTRTRCDESLLDGSRVRFVATATIGFDHIDTDYMRRAGITWTNCPGCNAGSVAQYVETSLLLLERLRGLNLRQSTLGLVGCGHVGSKVLAVAQRLGMRVLVCDPPLQQQLSTTLPTSPDAPASLPAATALSPNAPASLSAAPASAPTTPATRFVSLDVVEREADVITFHVPLTSEGPHATRHMADAAFFRRLTRVPYIINTSRGPVVAGDALRKALDDGLVRDAVLDVWEGEPRLDLTLLRRVFIGTPHIAGYSADGKVNADNMVIDALCRHFRLPHPGPIVPPPLPPGFRYTGDPLELYNPLTDSERLKAAPEQFEQLRNNYPLRRETV